MKIQIAPPRETYSEAFQVQPDDLGRIWAACETKACNIQ